MIPHLGVTLMFLPLVSKQRKLWSVDSQYNQK